MTQRRRSRPRRRVPRRRVPGTSMLRLRIGFLVIAMVVSVFAVRLFELQGVDAAAYVAKARAEGVVTVKLPATRGTITDRNGVPLADSVDGLMVVADPTLTAQHATAIATIVARRLQVDYFDVLARLQAPDTHFQYIDRRVPAAKARAVVKAIQAKGYKGIDVRRDPVRDYPGHDVAANILGFTNAMGQAGEGTELTFDDLLSGRSGSATYEVGGGNRLPLGDSSVVKPKAGKDLTLTIDRDLQWYAQRALRNAVRGSGAESGSAVVMDTATGELLALADYPTFDANDPTGSPESDLGARSVRDMYEPGSVQKVLTTSALLDKGLVTPRTKFRVPGLLPVQDRVIHDDVPHGMWHLTMTGVLARSSNIGAAMAARRISDKGLYDYLRAFGLGQPTGLGLRGETAGSLPPWKSWRPIRKANIAFGQGVAVSAVQMAAAINTVANGGVYVAPSLVKGKARMNDGRVVGSATSARHRVIGKHAARMETRMMETVTKEGGTAPNTAIPGYDIAGKTGTAERVDPRCGCYGSKHTVSFVGFAPADHPRLLVYVVVASPDGGFGSTVAGPVFKKLMGYALTKYGVPPSGHRDKTPPLTW